jgi:hypothetical protein
MKLDAPWFSDVNKNGDDVLSSEMSNVQYNGYVNELGQAYIRPGVKALIYIPQEIVAAYYNYKSEKVCVIDRFAIYSYIEVGNDSVLNFISSTSLTGNFGQKKPIYTIASTGDVFIATGGLLTRVVNDTTVSKITASNCPTDATHVSWIDGYIVVTNNTNTFYWSNLNDPLTWGVYNFANASGKGDIIVASFIVERQIYLIGTNSCEVWENDGVNPFSRVPGGFIEVGCAAPYSVARYNDTLYFISNSRKLVKIRGRTIEEIPGAYDLELSNIDLTDCYSDLLVVKNKTFILFQFPAANRTIAFEPDSQKWLEFGEWNSETLQWKLFNYKEAFYSPKYGRQFIVDMDRGTLGYLKENQSSDESYNTLRSGGVAGTLKNTPLKFLRRTGRIDHGKHERKLSNSVTFRIKRGVTEVSPKMFIRWRDDGSSVWSNERVVDLGNLGDTINLRALLNLGAYYNRQWEIAVTDATPFSISNIKEDIDILD